MLKSVSIKCTVLVMFVKLYTSGLYRKIHSQNKMLLKYQTGFFQHLSV